jgi:PKD repeat protein
MLTRPGRARRGRLHSNAFVLAVAVIALLAVPMGNVSRGAGTLALAGATGANSVGASALAAAESSLATGAGPADGVAVHCSASHSVGTECPMALAPAGGGTGSPAWGVLDPSPLSRAPFERAYAPLVWDASDGYVLMFGGGSESYSNYLVGDTWTFADGHWTLLHPTLSPSDRDAEVLAYDPSLGGGTVVLFGGYVGSYGELSVVENDTWTYHAGAWTNVTVPGAPAPPARWGSGFAYDAEDGYLLIFGGVNRDYDSFNDTWSYGAGGWTNRTAGTAPGPLLDPGMAYDAADSIVVLFGGYDTYDYATSDATWGYSAGTWTHLTVAGVPAGVEAPAMAYSSLLSEVVMYGGYNQTLGATLNSTWTFAAGVWTNVTVGANPGPNSYSSMAEEGPTGPMVLFGGFSYQTYTDVATTWTWAANNWTSVPTSGSSPLPTYGAEMAYDARDGEVVLFGGDNSTSDASNQTWTFSDGNWTQLFPPSAPTPTVTPAMTYDAAAGYLLLFGGETYSSVGNPGFTNQTWSFAGGTWTNLTASAGSSPFARYGATMTYDTATGAALLFGGYGYNSTAAEDEYFADTWSFSHGAWSELPASGPDGREGAAFVYDPLLNETLLFGGYSASTGDFDDTWLLNGTAWVYEDYDVTPIARDSASALWYPPTSTVVLIGGESEANGLLNDTWSFSGAGWANLASAGTPGWRLLAAFAFDPKSHAAILFGGGDESPLGDTWVLETVNASASATPVTGESPLSVSFTGSGSGGFGGYTYSWNFGDGSTSNLSAPTHVYAEGGNYTVTFTVTDVLGVTGTATLAIDTLPLFFAEPSASATAGVGPLTVNFGVTVGGGMAPYGFAWRFGDGGTSSVANPSHTYSSSGTYAVELWVNDSARGSLERFLNVTVLPAGSTGGSGTGGSSGFSWLSLAIGLGVGVIVGVLVGLALRGGSGRSSGPAAGSPPPQGAVGGPPPPAGPPPPPTG